MVLRPAKWVKHLMELTYLSWNFKGFIIAIGVGYLALAWVGENYVFQRVARVVGQIKEKATNKSKQRKEYKVIQEGMLF